MADTITLTFDTPTPQRTGGKSIFAMVSGSANLSAYTTAKTALTALTGMFMPSTGLLRVVADVSSNGYVIRWDTTAHAFRAYRASANSASAFVEPADATNIGTFNFLAFGLGG
jgi:hypothetical protein